MRQFTYVDFIGRTVLLASALSLAGCAADKPAAPDPTAQWCQEDVSIAGEWQAHRARSGHSYIEFLSIEEKEPCHLTYRYRARQLPDEEHPQAIEVFRSEGDMIVTLSGQKGPISYLAVESRRWLLEVFDPQGEVVTRDTSMTLLAASEAVLWDNRLSLWNNQYKRSP